MRVYIIKDSDFEALQSAIDRDPKNGTQGGSSQVLSDDEQRAHDRAHRFFNYQVVTWMQRMKRGDD